MNIATKLMMALGIPEAIVTAGQINFLTAGSHSWTVPPGITSISVQTVGGAGGGSGGAGNAYRQPAGNRGNTGASGYVNNITVTPGEVLNITIGAAGLAGNIGQSGTAGTVSLLMRGANQLTRAIGGNNGSAPPTSGISETNPSRPGVGTALLGTNLTVSVSGFGGAGYPRASSGGPGGPGAMRIIWGDTRSFPSNAGDA